MKSRPEIKIMNPIFKVIYEAAKKQDAKAIQQIKTRGESIDAPEFADAKGMIKICSTAAAKLARECNLNAVTFLRQHGASEQGIIYGFAIKHNIEEVTKILETSQHLSFPRILGAALYGFTLGKFFETADQYFNLYRHAFREEDAGFALNLKLRAHATIGDMIEVNRCLAMNSSALIVYHGLNEGAWFSDDEKALYILSNIACSNARVFIAGNAKKVELLNKANKIQHLMSKFTINYHQAIAWGKPEVQTWFLQCAPAKINQSKLDPNCSIAILSFLAPKQTKNNELQALAHKAQEYRQSLPKSKLEAQARKECKR